MKWKFLPPNSLEKLVRANKPVYVLNTSALPSGDKGTIVLTMYDGTRRDHFKSPATFIPMCITDAIPSSKICECRDLKQALLKGMLTLVDPDQAEDYLQTPEAREEYENLVLSEHSAKARNIDVESEITKRLKVTHTRNEGGIGPTQDVEAVDTVSNKVRGLMEDLVSGNKQAKEVLTELKRHQTALKAIDISYVQANAADPELSKWAKKALLGVASDEDETPAPATKKKATVVAKPAKKEPVDAFDFGAKDDDMTPEERAADAAAQAKFLSQQALSGQSQVDDEINKLLSGKM
jgi:hypothetical protein